MAKEETITMNNKEILRLQVVKDIDTRRLKQGEASKLLGISCRQVRVMVSSPYNRQR